MTTTSREVRLAARPIGFPKSSDFEIVTVEPPADHPHDPAAGHLDRERHEPLALFAGGVCLRGLAVVPERGALEWC